MKHFWKYVLLAILAFGVYEIYSYGLLAKPEFFKTMVHIIFSAFH